MKEVAELPADLLEGRLPLAPEPDDSHATRISRVAQLADRGDYATAARDAAELIADEIYDFRLIGFYLFGLFLQRGVSCLPALLARIAALMTDDLAALRPGRRKPQVVNSAAAWLFEHVSAHLAFHAKHRDATWDAWCSTSDAAVPEAIATGCTKVIVALETVIDAPLAAVPLARIRRWAQDELRRAVVRRDVAETAAAVAVSAAPSSAPGSTPVALAAGAAAPPEEPEALHDDGASLDDTLAVPPGPRIPTAIARHHLERAGLPDDAAAPASPALAVLQTKLRGFQDLVARGELARAAIVASDVRAVLASFDPVAYFPATFAGYFKVLSQVIDELAPYFHAADQPSWHALDAYYRADLRAFLED